MLFGVFLTNQYFLKIKMIDNLDKFHFNFSYANEFSTCVHFKIENTANQLDTFYRCDF